MTQSTMADSVERRARRTSITVEGLAHKFPVPNACRIGNLVVSSAIHGVDPVTRTMPEDWEERARAAFLEGYFREVDPALLPPGQESTEKLLSVFELEKAVYELNYEINNRPDWVGIPVQSILRLLEAE